MIRGHPVSGQPGDAGKWGPTGAVMAPVGTIDGETTGGSDVMPSDSEVRPAVVSPASSSPTQGGELAGLAGSASVDNAGFRLGNRPPLTGIRAFVIGTILVYHSNFHTFTGAWTAISVFFVLSGFLITSMLMGEHQRTGRISISHFYARRALRLLPPLFITVALLGIYAALVFVPDAPQRVWGDASSAVFYYADFRSASGREPFFGYLAQTWSLSIEEQFYVIWSLLMLAAMGMGKRRAAYAVAVSGAVIGASYACWMILSAPNFTSAVANRVYFGFGSRVDALFVGCVLGLLATGGHLSRPGAWLRRMIALMALASAGGLAWMVVNVPFGNRQSLLWWLPISIIASAFLITYFVVCPEGHGSRFVGFAPFVLIGNLTYTLYLVHWPVYVALSPLTTTLSFWPLEALRLAIIFGIALLSWYLVERPLMRWRRRALA